MDDELLRQLMRVLKFLVQDVHTARTAVLSILLFQSIFLFIMLTSRKQRERDGHRRVNIMTGLLIILEKRAIVLHAVSVSVSVHSIFRLLIILKKLPLILENKMFYKT